MPFMATRCERDVYFLAPILRGAESLQQGFNARKRLGFWKLVFLDFMEFGSIRFRVDVREVEEGEEAEDGFVGWSALKLRFYVPSHGARVMSFEEDVMA